MALSRDVRKPEITSKDLDFMMHERKSISFFFGEVMQGLPISSLFSEVSVLAKAKLYRRYQIHCSWVSFLKYILETNEQFQLKRNLNIRKYFYSVLWHVHSHQCRNSRNGLNIDNANYWRNHAFLTLNNFLVLSIFKPILLRLNLVKIESRKCKQATVCRWISVR